VQVHHRAQRGRGLVDLPGGQLGVGEHQGPPRPGDQLGPARGGLVIIAEATLRAALRSLGRLCNRSAFPARSALASTFEVISRSSTSSASSIDTVSRCRTVASSVADGAAPGGPADRQSQ
jgi:hypothetical protein